MASTCQDPNRTSSRQTPERSGENNITIDTPITRLIRLTKSQPAGLLDLPAEIWSKIGHYAIDAELVYTLKDICSPDCLPFDQIEFNGIQWPHQPAITRTCRVLREELLPYFYQTKVTFTIQHASTSQEYIRGFLKGIGASNRQNIRYAWAEGKKRRPVGLSRKVVSHYVGDLPLNLVPVERDRYGTRFEKGELYLVRFSEDDDESG